MKFTIPSKTLHSLTSSVSKVINSKNALTILNNFLFSLKDGMLEITGSDVENSLTARHALESSIGEGLFCIDARSLVDLLKELPDQPLDIEINDDTLQVEITSPSGKYTMIATQGDMYPSYRKDDENEESKLLEISAAALQQGLEKTAFAIGTDDFHPQMMGTLLDITPDNITFVATDTRKLVRFRNTKIAPGVQARCIMPVKPASIIRSIFSKDDQLAITFTSKCATIETPTFVFNFRFIKGNFPDYNRVIPENNPYTLEVDRQRFLNAVRRVGVFVDPGFGLVKFKITNDHINLKSNDDNMLKAGNEVLDCVYEGPDLVIGFNAPFLIDICSAIPTEKVIVKLSDPSRPGVFRPSTNDEDTDMLVLLMPMNVVEF